MAKNPNETGFKIKVEGLATLQKELRQLGGDGMKDALKALNREAADTVADAARSRIPVRSGNLAATLRTSSTLRTGVVRIGKAKVPYAGPIHFGWPKRHIRPQPFMYDALDARYNEVVELYYDRLNKLINESISENPRD